MTKLRLRNTAHKYSSTILHAKAKALFIDELGCDIASPAESTTGDLRIASEKQPINPEPIPRLPPLRIAGKLTIVRWQTPDIA